MKAVLLSLTVLLFVAVSPAYGQQALSDAPGLVNRLDVQSAGHTFEVMTVSNFDIHDHDFDRGEKSLTMHISSGLENNLAEVIIPSDLLGGNITFFLNDQEHPVNVRSSGQASFVVINFTGSGDHRLKILGTLVLPVVAEGQQPGPDDATSDANAADADDLGGGSESIAGGGDEEGEKAGGGGCLIATAAFGTELAPQIQQLREIRDGQLSSTRSGDFFLDSFNAAYYSFSPYVADHMRESPLFKDAVRLFITPMMGSLSLLGYVDVGTEASAVAYGTALILLNAGIYVGIPASVTLVGLRRRRGSSLEHDPDPASNKDSYRQYD